MFLSFFLSFVSLLLTDFLFTCFSHNQINLLVYVALSLHPPYSFNFKSYHIFCPKKIFTSYFLHIMLATKTTLPWSLYYFLFPLNFPQNAALSHLLTLLSLCPFFTHWTSDKVVIEPTALSPQPSHSVNKFPRSVQ